MTRPDTVARVTGQALSLLASSYLITAQVPLVLHTEHNFDIIEKSCLLLLDAVCQCSSSGISATIRATVSVSRHAHRRAPDPGPF